MQPLTSTIHLFMHTMPFNYFSFRSLPLKQNRNFYKHAFYLISSSPSLNKIFMLYDLSCSKLWPHSKLNILLTCDPDRVHWLMAWRRVGYLKSTNLTIWWNWPDQTYLGRLEATNHHPPPNKGLVWSVPTNSHEEDTWSKITWAHSPGGLVRSEL